MAPFVEPKADEKFECMQNTICSLLNKVHHFRQARGGKLAITPPFEGNLRYLCLTDEQTIPFAGNRNGSHVDPLIHLMPYKTQMIKPYHKD